ncbi:MAG: hypothetical protein UZ17_ACD001002325 [Acidobacteria bacterium OLB17]|nr:MAG: hypothetical protein UZ17_ACD001002325 [Acidobacteria bacterium OLB17]
MIARCLAMGFTNRRAALVGVFAAFAVTTKDQAFGPLFLGLLALVAVYLWQNKADLSAIRTWKFPFVLGLCGSIAFVFASGLVISPHRFIGHFVYIRNYEQNFYGITARFGQPATLYGYSVLTWEVLTELFFSIGPVFLAVGIAGLLLTLRTGPFTRILCAMLVGHLVFVVWAVRYTQFRYIILTTYIFSFFIGRALAVSIQDERPRWLVPVALSCAIAGYGWLGLRCVNLTYQMYFDSRYQAGKWLDQNSRPGDELAFFTSQNVLPPINADIQLLKLFADPAPMDKVLGNSPRYILGQPDFASPIGSDRSYFFPDSVYNELGNLGYTATAKFETPPLFERFFLNDTLVGPGYYVNPPITVFEKTK